jgi:hypothetical protein
MEAIAILFGFTLGAYMNIFIIIKVKILVFVKVIKVSPIMLTIELRVVIVF